MYSNEKGFTIIEIIAVVIIIGILTAIALPRFIGVQDDAEENVCEGNVATMNVQLERYYHENGAFPADADAFAAFLANAAYFPDGAPTCPGGSYTYTAASGRVAMD